MPENQPIKNIPTKNFIVRTKQSPTLDKPGFADEILLNFLPNIFPEFKDGLLRHKRQRQLP